MRRRGDGMNRMIRSQSGVGIIDDAKTVYNVGKSYLTHGEFPGEHHALSMDPRHKGQLYQFVGPGTNVSTRVTRGDAGLNDLDRTARSHDIAYQSAVNTYKKTSDKKGFTSNIWSADDTFIKEAATSRDDPNMGKISAKLIKAKRNLEQAGVLPTKVFSGAGGQGDPAQRLRDKIQCSDDIQYEECDQVGGWIGPLISILSAVAPPVIEYLWGKFGPKKGSGLSPVYMSTSKKRDLLINRLLLEGGRIQYD